MGTYAQPGITQGQALMAEKADYASGLSKAIGVAKLSKDNQMAMIETSKNALAKQTAELMQEANKIQSSDNSELADSFKQTIIDQIDALDLLEYNSIGRDQTEVTKMRSNLLNGVEGATGNFMKLLAEAEDYNKRVVNGTSPKTVSNTNSNPEAIPFLNALGVNNGRQVKTEWDGLGFNLSYKDPSTGKEFKINPTNYYAGREQGLSGLWNEVQDPSPTFKASYDQLAKNFPNINRVTETTGADGRLTTVASLDSRKAYDNVRNGILNDKIIRNGISGDTLQFLAGSGYYDKGIGATYDPDDKNQESELMEAIANYTMDQYSKGSGNQITDVKTKIAKSNGKGDGDIDLDYTDFISNAKLNQFSEDGTYASESASRRGLRKNIINKLISMNPGKILKGDNKEIVDELEDDAKANKIYAKTVAYGKPIYTLIDVKKMVENDDMDGLNQLLINYTPKKRKGSDFNN